MKHRPDPNRPVTAERIERCLDGIAELIVEYGSEGEAFLPLYEYLDAALADIHAKDARLAAVYDRVRRSRHQTEARS